MESYVGGDIHGGEGGRGANPGAPRALRGRTVDETRLHRRHHRFCRIIPPDPASLSLLRGIRSGWGTYKAALIDENSVHAIKMTLLVAAIAVPLNTIFGVAAAWAIAKFNFKGKALLTTVIDIPFAISPVIAGLIFVLLFGRQGLLGWWLSESVHARAHSLDRVRRSLVVAMGGRLGLHAS